ncbi:M81 family metallopeptidase [Aquamicrobium sp. LC103]|uniref:M81 family metallopeptidase n=1 Tax=Aquamicrobium sp. LC103 TaxID=1120658 RepID=UPI00063EC328|nr:M81 family metallopeptidase [Aquamicrobium sp. LC103]TKT74461.1 M81 family metallopeptidase [Aquamicrobium sp. LC103]
MPARVLIAEFMHETNTFSVQKTDRTSFEKCSLYLENEISAAFVNTRTFMGAGYEATEEFGWTIVTPLVAGATPAGRVTDACFEEFAAILLAATGEVDGILLHLHGSMSTESHDDGEGELLARIRATVGPAIPIVVVLDLHATVTQRMADNTSALISYRTYPHIDQYERGHQAAALLDRAMQGAIRPKVAIARRPILYAMDGGRTTSAPMVELLKRADALEASGEALVVSVQAGFSSADVHDIGPSIAVTAEDGTRARAIAEELMDYVWQERHWSTITFTPLEEAIAEAALPSTEGKPLVISDYSDNPGSGAYGDATTLLRAILDARLTNVGFYAICDPEAVLRAQEAGVGNRVRLKLGGKVDPTVGGSPLDITAEVVTLSDGRFIAYGPMGGGAWRNHGLSALLRVDGVEIAVITNNGQATDLAQFTSLGVEPQRKSTLVVKSMQHFRAAFQPIARKVIEVDTGALSTKNFFIRPYRNTRRPIWPLDDI